MCCARVSRLHFYSSTYSLNTPMLSFLMLLSLSQLLSAVSLTVACAAVGRESHTLSLVSPQCVCSRRSCSCFRSRACTLGRSSSPWTREGHGEGAPLYSFFSHVNTAQFCWHHVLDRQGSMPKCTMPAVLDGSAVTYNCVEEPAP